MLQRGDAQPSDQSLRKVQARRKPKMVYSHHHQKAGGQKGVAGSSWRGWPGEGMLFRSLGHSPDRHRSRRRRAVHQRRWDPKTNAPQNSPSRVDTAGTVAGEIMDSLLAHTPTGATRPALRSAGRCESTPLDSHPRREPRLQSAVPHPIGTARQAPGQAPAFATVSACPFF